MNVAKSDDAIGRSEASGNVLKSPRWLRLCFVPATGEKEHKGNKGDENNGMCSMCHTQNQS
jgi:hypothetical protein